MQKKLHELVPKYVPEPLSYKNGIMKSKKYGVSLRQWLKTHKYKPEIVQNVRLILRKIRRKYPGFRHMDLHIGNVLVYRGRLMIIDFGLSKLNAKNVPLNRDMSVFLKSLRRMISKVKCSRNLTQKSGPTQKSGTKPCNCGCSGGPTQKSGPESAASIAKRIMSLK